MASDLCVYIPTGEVGFSSLPSQLYRRISRKSLTFCLIIVAQSGLGKSTFINSMFRSDICSRKGISDVPLKTVTLDCHKVILEENGVKLYLTVVNTPGFGDQLDNRQCCQPIAAFLEEQFQRFLQADTAVHRDNIQDTRVHVCLYFIAPSGHGLQHIDVQSIKIFNIIVSCASIQ